MKKIILSAFVVAGFAAAAFGLPGYKIQVVETKAAACDHPSCAAG